MLLFFVMSLCLIDHRNLTIWNLISVQYLLAYLSQALLIVLNLAISNIQGWTWFKDLKVYHRPLPSTHLKGQKDYCRLLKNFQSSITEGPCSIKQFSPKHSRFSSTPNVNSGFFHSITRFIVSGTYITLSSAAPNHSKSMNSASRLPSHGTGRKHTQVAGLSKFGSVYLNPSTSLASISTLMLAIKFH